MKRREREGEAHLLRACGLSAPGTGDLMEDVLAGLGAARDALQRAAQAVDGIRDVAASRPVESRANLVARVEAALGQVLASVGPIDADLGTAASRLADARVDAQQLGARTRRFIFLATVGGGVLMLWIAVGQAALCLGGWRGWRRRANAHGQAPARAPG